MRAFAGVKAEEYIGELFCLPVLPENAEIAIKTPEGVFMVRIPVLFLEVGDA